MIVARRQAQPEQALKTTQGTMARQTLLKQLWKAAPNKSTTIKSGRRYNKLPQRLEATR